MKTFIGILLLTLSSLARAEDFPFDTTTNATEQIEKGLSEKNGVKEKDQQDLTTDKLSIGGSLRSDFNLYQIDSTTIDDFIQQPSVLSLYLDSNLADNVRGFFRGKFTYDGTVDETSPTSALPGLVPKRSLAQLDEMKIQFQIEKSVFVSLGIQKIKWGSGHFWNPTDFLNLQARDILEKEDRRAGRDLIKIHFPWRDMNFYAIANFEDSTQSKNLGSAFRGEVPFANSLTSGEISLTQYNKQGQDVRYGADLSMALGPIDVYCEGAGSKTDQSRSSVAGLSYDWQYSDEDLLNISYEYYWNESGATSTSDYSALLLAKKFVPFHVAKTYQLVSLYLPKPGHWQNSDLVLLLIRNGVDESTYSRIGYTWSGFRDLSLSAFMGRRTGKSDSELAMGGLTSDYTLRAEIKF